MKTKDISKLRTKSIKGLSLLVAREVVIKIVAAIGQLLLVRLLSPQFFGIFAILTFLINVADLFTDFGLVSAIIREKNELHSRTISTIFTVKMLCTLSMVIGLNIFAHFLLSHFLHDASYIVAFRIMTLTLLLRPYKTIAFGLLERELRYESIPLVDIIGLCVYFAIGGVGAVFQLGVWSLIVAIIVKDISEVGILLYVRRWIPRLEHRFGEIRSLMHFGAPLQLATIVGFIHQSSVPLLGGLLSTPAAVGILDTSSNIASLPRALTDNVGRVSFSSFSRIQDETEILSRASQRAISILTLPLLLLLNMSLALGPAIVEVVLTSKWQGILAPLNWYLVSGIFLSCIAVLQQAIIARGETVWLLKLSTLTLLCEWIVAVILFQFVGFIAFPMAASLSAGALFGQYVILGRFKKIHINLIHSLFPNLIIFSFVEGINLGLSSLVLPAIWLLVAKSIILPTCFLIFSIIFARPAINWMISLAREFIFHDIINEN